MKNAIRTVNIYSGLIWTMNSAAAASGMVNWPFFGTILLRRSERTQSASFKVIAAVLLKILSCKNKAQKLLETGNVYFYRIVTHPVHN